MQPNRSVSQDEWLTARRALLAKEKAPMRAGDALADGERRFLLTGLPSLVHFIARPATRDSVDTGRGSLPMCLPLCCRIKENETICL